MKKLYESPELEFVFFSADVVRTSNEAEGGWGDNWTGLEAGGSWGDGGWSGVGGDGDLFG